MDSNPPGSSDHGIFQARGLENALLQGIFQPRGPTRICLHLLHCRRICYLLSHLGSPYVCMCVCVCACVCVYTHYKHTSHTHTHTHTHIFSIHSSAIGHLDCFYILAIINSASMNIEVHVSFQINVSVFGFLYVYPGEKLLSHMVILCFRFFEKSPYCFPQQLHCCNKLSQI